MGGRCKYGARMRTFLWRGESGHERCVVAPDPQGFHVGGTAVYAIDGMPIEVRYSVLTDEEWRTRVVGVHVQTGDATRRLALHADGEGGWSVADEPQLDLFGAIDADLTFTPATNTLPIRRLALEVGGEIEIAAVVVDPLADGLRRATQRYARIGPDRYRYEAGGFSTVIMVDDEGWVVEYPGAWTMVASS